MNKKIVTFFENCHFSLCENSTFKDFFKIILKNIIIMSLVLSPFFLIGYIISIHVFESIQLNKYPELIKYSIMTVFFFAFTSPLLKIATDNDELSLSDFLIVFPISGTLFLIKKTFYLTFISLNFNRNKLFNEIKEFKLQKKHSTPTPKQNTITDPYPHFSDLEQWVEENVSKSRAIKKVFHKFTTKNSNTYDKSLLIWSQIIPISLIDDNTKLDLLKMNKIPPVFSSKSYKFNSDIVFKNYNSNQLKNVFLGSYNVDQLIKMMDNLDDVHPIPVFSNMKDVMLYLEFIKKRKNMKELNAPNVDLTDPSQKIFLIKDSLELFTIAKEFENCAITYLKDNYNPNYAFYIIKKDNPILFHVDHKLNLKEAKYKFNKELSKEDFHLITSHVEAFKSVSSTLIPT